MTATRRDYLTDVVLRNAQHISDLPEGTVLQALPLRDGDREPLALAWRVVTTDNWAVTGRAELYSSVGLLSLCSHWRVVTLLDVDECYRE